VPRPSGLPSWLRRRMRWWRPTALARRSRRRCSAVEPRPRRTRCRRPNGVSPRSGPRRDGLAWPLRRVHPTGWRCRRVVVGWRCCRVRPTGWRGCRPVARRCPGGCLRPRRAAAGRRPRPSSPRPTACPPRPTTRSRCARVGLLGGLGAGPGGASDGLPRPTRRCAAAGRRAGGRRRRRTTRRARRVGLRGRPRCRGDRRAGRATS